MYAVGGFNGSLRVRTVDAYDPVKDEWCCVSSMQDRRSTLGSAFLNGLLYAVGGFDGSTGNILHYLAYCLCGNVHSCHVGYGNNARYYEATNETWNEVHAEVESNELHLLALL